MQVYLIEHVCNDVKSVADDAVSRNKA